MTRLGGRAADEGFSLIEVVVTLAILGVLLSVVATAIVQVYRTSVKAESMSIAQGHLHRAFQRLDKELRYASWIAEPGAVGTAWYVEFAGSDGTQCLQLRLETAGAAQTGTDGHGVLQLLRWTPGSPPVRDAPGHTLASNLVTVDGEAPFERQMAGTSPYAPADGIGVDFTADFERLRIRLRARAGTGTAQVDTTFTALNTSRETPATHPCGEGRPT